MIAFSLILAAIAAGGAGAFRALWQFESRAGRIASEAGPFERVVASAVCGIAMWTALNWICAFTHLLRAPVTIALAILVTSGGGLAFYRLRDQAAAPKQVERAALVLVIVSPLLLWIAYMGVRGLLMPVVSPDGNAYHLPKALLLMENDGYRAFVHPDFRVTSYPFDYELLLSNVMSIDGTDRETVWITIAFFVLFMLATAAHAERFQEESAGETRALRALASMMVVAAAPIVLLQAGTHKNDLMAATFATLAFLFVARWILRGERLYGALTIVCVALTLGTKPSGAFVALGVAPFFLVGANRVLRKERGLREMAMQLGAALAAFALLGGVVILVNLARSHHPFGVSSQYLGDTGYGAWKNLVLFPGLLLVRPFTESTGGIYIPWRNEQWWWMTYEMHTSHYGWLFSLVAAAALVLVILDWRAKKLARTWALVAGILTAAIMVPLRISPAQEGYFNAFPRYLLFALPPIAGYVIPRIFEALSRLPKRVHADLVLVLLLTGNFAWWAVRVARRDMYQPFAYVLLAFGADAPVRQPVQARDRAAFALDEVAGPRDKVLFDASYDSWTYPAYGADWKRPVTLVYPGLEPVTIPDDVEWVVSDHAYEKTWGHPDFKTMGQIDTYLNRGKASPESLRMVKQLTHDARFRLVYRNVPTNQALFKRRAPGESPGNEPNPVIIDWAH